VRNDFFEKIEVAEMVVGIASKIEHTLLEPETTSKDVRRVCEETLEHGFFGVCIPPIFVSHAKKILDNSKQKVITVVGFPFGYNVTSAKVEETKRAIDDGADEIDMVMNIAAFKDRNFQYVINDVQSVTTISQLLNKKIKLIIESGILSETDIQKACEIAKEAGVDFVKTSTGYSSAGVTAGAVKLIRSILPKKIKIKAAGGIRSRIFAEELIDAGADRLGCSHSLQVIEE
jgi:deoxyribose-phosphate aldolase